MYVFSWLAYFKIIYSLCWWIYTRFFWLFAGGGGGGVVKWSSKVLNVRKTAVFFKWAPGMHTLLTCMYQNLSNAKQIKGTQYFIVLPTSKSIIMEAYMYIAVKHMPD